MNNLVEVNEEYEAKMAGFEIDCNDSKGETAACHHVGEFYAIVKEDHKRASITYRENCNRGYSPSCFNLARLYLSGRGVEQSDTTAESLFEKSCQGGHLSGCYHYGLFKYIMAKEKIDATPSTEHSIIKANQYKMKDAIKLLEDTCHKGDIDSCHFAGNYYIDSENKDRNPVKALDLLTRSCELNHAASCFNLAVMYKNGEKGVVADQIKFNEYKKRTEDLVQQYGQISGHRIA